jgi:2-alkenal reductase
MKRNRNRTLLALLTITLFALAACRSAGNEVTDTPAPVAQAEPVEVDTAAIVSEVVATIAAQQAALPLPTPEIVAAVETTTETTTAVLGNDLEANLIDIYERVNPAVVSIFVFDSTGQVEGSGSGFVIDTAGHVVTNNHVVAGSDGLEVVFANGERRAAELIGTDIDSDLAVIQLESLPDGVIPVPLGDSNDIAVGQFVVAIGNPFGEAGSMSVGIVSGLGRTLSSQRLAEGGGRYSLPRVIQTDAAINPGNSGGPLLNLRGEVVGVNSAIRTSTGTNSGVGFSIPVNAVNRVVPVLISEGAYTYPFMGISMTSIDLARQERLELPQTAGAYVTAVSAGTPAEAAGMVASGITDLGEPLPGGDLIIAVDGTPVGNPDDLISFLVFETEVGQTINLTVIRNGEEMNIPLTLGERP